MRTQLNQMGRMLLVPALLCACALLAAEPASAQPTRTVGSVYGKPVTAADIGLSAQIDPAVEFDARDTKRWNLMNRIAAIFGRPVVERFVQKRKIQATSAEIEEVKSNLRKGMEDDVRKREAELAELEKELAAPGLSGQAKARLEQKRARQEELITSTRPVAAAAMPDEFARQMIVAWKVERELHRAYGGRVIFQQAGPEALDARRRLFEEAEKNGDIRFDDAGVRRMFYYYSNMNHVTVDEKSLEQPWFLTGTPKK